MSGPSIPFSEPPWLNGLPSAYYKPSHHQWQKACREFIQENLSKHAVQWEDEGQVPEHVFAKFAENNMLVPTLPAPLPVKWLKKLEIHEILGTLKVEDFDYLHHAIFTDEMYRCGLRGPAASLVAGMASGLPPILNFGSSEVQERLLPELLAGKKRICIAITEPDAGSDVANLTTTAKKTADGKHYIVNGTKKWITNGLWSSYATMAVRTGEPGAKGISLLVVPLLGHEGVTMEKINISGSSVSGTTFIELKDVKVPVENLVGAEGTGMRNIMTTLNHERLTLAIAAIRGSRKALSTATAYVMKREAFGKPLMEQAVVRQRLARAGTMLESQWAWIEAFAYQLTQLPKQDADRELGGLLAMCKAQGGVVLDECSRTAVILFGGSGLTKGGAGDIVEKIYRDVPSARIPGGSEDVMLDLGVRQLVKLYKAKSQTLQNGSSELQFGVLTNDKNLPKSEVEESAAVIQDQEVRV